MKKNSSGEEVLEQDPGSLPVATDTRSPVSRGAGRRLPPVSACTHTSARLPLRLEERFVPAVPLLSSMTERDKNRE